jgi:dTDP-4-dehydrorhamnose reductase
MSRWLVTGAAGMLGQDLVSLLRRQGEPVTGLARHELDVTDPVAVAHCIGGHKPDVVVNCAACPRPAPRPGCSVLAHGAWAPAGVAPIGDWDGALARAMPAMTATSDC